MSIFNKTSKTQPLGRNSFDLSQKKLFTASAGELLPCFCQEVLPGDKFRIKVQDFLRTQTCNTAAYSRLKQYVHFFYVPTRILSTLFGQYVTRSPRVDSTSFTPFSGSPIDETFSKYRGRFTFPIYPVITSLCKGAVTVDYAKFKGMPLSSILSDSAFQEDIVRYQSLKLLELLDYGVGSYQYNIFAPIDKLSFDFAHQDFGVGSSLTSANQTRCNAFRLLAYNRIYQDFYRDSRLETFNSIYSNIDDITNQKSTVFPQSDVDSAWVNRFLDGTFRLRYRNYPYDYFTSADVNPFRQDSLLNRAPFQQGVNLPSTLGLAPGKDVDLKFPVNGIVGSQMPVLSPTFDINNVTSLRALYALERWASRQAHAKSQSYADLVKAHFGIDVIDEYDKSRFLGGASAPVVISENISTAETEGASLGSLSGVGKSNLSDNTISFTAKEHGIIMGIFSIMPEPDYNAYGIDRQNLHSLPEDFFTPEFDGLGYQAVNTVELSNIATSTLLPEINNSSVDQLNKVFGFMPIYSEYRTAIDKVYGDFKTELPLSYWVNPRRIASYNDTITSSFGKVLPSDLDSIFQVNWLQLLDVPAIGHKQNALTTVQLNDQFFVNMYLDCKAIRHMSSDGVLY